MGTFGGCAAKTLEKWGLSREFRRDHRVMGTSRRNGRVFSTNAPPAHIVINEEPPSPHSREAAVMAQDREIVIETRRLTKIYRDFWGRQKKVALRALNLQIYRGEIFGL